ncbi:MAG: PilN domain-containing protein [Pseudomonadota bacterium]
MARSLITSILRRRESRQTLCLEIRPDGIAWALSPGAAGQQAGFAECLPAKREAVLSELVRYQGWAGTPTTLVLPLDKYQVFQLERPEGIDDAELGDALKWKLKDFLDFSPTDAVSDVFPFPADAARGRGQLVNVVAARKSLVSEQVGLVLAAGLELVAVDVAELALRNLIARLDPQNRGAALVHLRDAYGQMVIAKGAELYLSRRLDVVSDDLKNASTQENAVQSLALEMQRSLDYYESQLGQVPPAVIRLVARDSMLPLSSMLSSYVAAGVDTLDWTPFDLPAALDSRCVPAWSAGLGTPEGGQKVNLYTEELRPRREKLQASTVLPMLLFALVVIVLGSVFARYQASGLETRQAALQQQNGQLEAAVEQLSVEVSARRPDPELEAALARINSDLARRQRLLERVESLVTGDSPGFSAQMSALARQVPDRLWLTGFTLEAEPGRVALTGGTREAANVPAMLENLGSEPSFAGRTFGSFALERDEDGRWIRFRVATDESAGDER